MTDLINKTTAMPAVLWTDWMKSSKNRRKGVKGNRPLIIQPGTYKTSHFLKMCTLAIVHFTISEDVYVAAHEAV